MELDEHGYRQQMLLDAPTAEPTGPVEAEGPVEDAPEEPEAKPQPGARETAFMQARRNKLAQKKGRRQATQ